MVPYVSELKGKRNLSGTSTGLGNGLGLWLSRYAIIREKARGLYSLLNLFGELTVELANPDTLNKGRKKSTFCKLKNKVCRLKGRQKITKKNP